ncbi:probable alpha-mannosidase At5g13980 [Helianthus annuus]|uniref:probable alpha-mannosidase At5g13980 n=1 Tax=Helianthus annuus TaxID=4232 RepID=UPI00165328CC|nr:probable alpha-mannosidase At5g13980 [Helianthus annuus]
MSASPELLSLPPSATVDSAADHIHHFKYQKSRRGLHAYGSEGKLSHYVNSRSAIDASLKQSYSFYAGFDGTTGLQASGAYIFRPSGTYPIGSQKQITRVYKNKEHAEVEFTVGLIPIGDGVGKEIATKISTTIKSNQTFYTDSNGRDFIERIRDYRADWDLEVNQPIAGNYYPINLGIYLKDEKSELSVLVDRSVGGSSIVDGELELMLHRRLLYDDGKGVAKAINEAVCVGNDCRGLAISISFYY